MKPFSLVFIVAIKSADSFNNHVLCNNRREIFSFDLAAVPPKGGLTFEDSAQEGSSTGSTTSLPFQNRGKVNEIDFCMSPSDVSLSRSYGISSGKTIDVEIGGTSPTQQPRILSLTRALNNASNRALRRILLSRSWPSAEALNMSLRQVLASKEDTKGESDAAKSNSDESILEQNSSTAKCPVPRPILNVIMRQTEEIEADKGFIDGATPVSSSPIPQKRTDETWVEDQMKVFREGYGQLPGYEYADSYLECILSLATTGIESSRVSEVVAGGVYDDSYRRFLSVLKSVGTVFEGTDDLESPKMKIATKLIDQDICLSMLDKIAIRNEKRMKFQVSDLETDKVQKADESIEIANDREQKEIEGTVTEKTEEEKVIVKDEESGRNRLLFWMKPRKAIAVENEEPTEPEEIDYIEVEREKVISPEDLGGVLLSAEEPTVTRQLNVLSNIVKRTLLFGGDQELLVLSETLNADKLAFIQRWYPNTGESVPPKEETRPGVQYFNCLVQLLEDSYNYGEITDLDPPFQLFPSFANSYERLTAYLVELGSGYINVVGSKEKTPLPKTPTEELQRFTQWESALRKTANPDVAGYPEDLLGSWQVKDEIGGKIIGTSTVVFRPDGEVFVDPPVRGLRWHVDPGPTHLDTCTFQVLSEDGAILQYRGFMDRGARLESRFSKRSIKIRGAVTFQMRYGDSAMGAEFKKDMLPITSQTGTTRFVMSKVFDLESK